MKQRRIQVLGAVAALCAAFAVLVQLQPIGDPWWTNPDPNVAYVSAGVSLFGGRESRYFDHPGTPIEELVAAALTVDWAIDPHGQSRSERADALFRDFDSTRPLFRTLAIGIYPQPFTDWVVSAIMVFSNLADPTASLPVPPAVILSGG